MERLLSLQTHNANYLTSFDIERRIALKLYVDFESRASLTAMQDHDILLCISSGVPSLQCH